VSQAHQKVAECRTETLDDLLCNIDTWNTEKKNCYLLTGTIGKAEPNFDAKKKNTNKQTENTKS